MSLWCPISSLSVWDPLSRPWHVQKHVLEPWTRSFHSKLFASKVTLFEIKVLNNFIFSIHWTSWWNERFGFKYAHWLPLGFIVQIHAHHNHHECKISPFFTLSPWHKMMCKIKLVIPYMQRLWLQNLTRTQRELWVWVAHWDPLDN